MITKCSWNESSLNKYLVNGKNIALPWGVEFADSNSFYSIEKGIGLRNEEIIIEHSISNETMKTMRQVKLSEIDTSFALDEKYNSETNVLSRDLTLIALEDGYLMDFVLRYRFKKKSITSFIIDGKNISHSNSNIYHQYSVNSVIGITNEGAFIEIDFHPVTLPSSMTPVMYVRDQKGEWVIHCRFIPKSNYSGSKEIIKLCSSWVGTRALPSAISQYILKFKKIKNFLWYKAELRPYKNKIIRYFFNFSAYTMAKINKNQKLRIKSTMRVIYENK